jgi:hypothetical protein
MTRNDWRCDDDGLSQSGVFFSLGEQYWNLAMDDDDGESLKSDVALCQRGRTGTECDSDDRVPTNLNPCQTTTDVVASR